MALPQWITPAGNLGIVPELEYYEFNLDTYDASGGVLVYNLISGRLPPGIQIVSPPNFPNGQLRGIPISESTTEKNSTYKFTIRVTNATTKAVADRTFNITITNIAPPIIIPKGADTVIVFEGNTVTANVGDFFKQPLTNANALVISNAVNTTRVAVEYQNDNEFITANVGNSSINVSLTTNGIYPGNAITYTYTANLNSFPLAVESNSRYLGLFADGEEINIQLEAIDQTPNSQVTWTLKRGDLPSGLSITPDGLITGYIDPIPVVFPGFTPGWDATTWNYLGWDFPQKSATKTFTFTVEVSDGINYDQANYKLTVAPRGIITADDNITRINTEYFEGVRLTADLGKRHNPIITTVQSDLSNVRQGSYLSLNIDAIDLDGDRLKYSVPTLASGSFDEQIYVGNSFPYVAEKPVSNRLTKGVFPKVTIDAIASTINLYPGNAITANLGDTITQAGSGATGTVTANVTNSPRIPIIVSGSNFTTTRGNLFINGVSLEYAVPNAAAISSGIAPVQFGTGTSEYIAISGNVGTVYPTFATRNSLATYTLNLSGNITANIGEFITQSSTGANAVVILNNVLNATVVDVQYVAGFWSNIKVVPQSVTVEGPTVAYDYTTPNLINGDKVKVLQTDFIGGGAYDLWHVATVTDSTTIVTEGPTPLQATIGATISQSFSGASATITDLDTAIGTIGVAGVLRTGYITTFGRLPQITLNMTGVASLTQGSYITQLSSGANAVVLSNTSISKVVTLQYTSGSPAFTINSASTIHRLASNGANISVAPTWTNNTAVVFSTTGFLPNILVGSTSTNLTSGQTYYVSNVSANTFQLSYFPGGTVINLLTGGSGTHTIPATGQTVTFTAGSTDRATAVASPTYPTSSTDLPNAITFQANVGDYITQTGTSANAVVLANVVNAVAVPIRFISSNFGTGGGNIKINGANVSVYPTYEFQQISPIGLTVNNNDYITQVGGNANVKVNRANVFSATSIPVEYVSGIFNPTGNLRVNGVTSDVYPTSVLFSTNVQATYSTVAPFRLNIASGNVSINSNPTDNIPSDVIDVGITIAASPSTEGVTGFGESKYDQGTLGLPGTLTLNTDTGWITGYVPSQSASRIDYTFEVLTYKRDYTIYRDTQLYTLTVLGDLNNNINWITPSDLGSIYNGKISDLYVQAESTKGKVLYYDFKPNSANRLPQGLILTSTGLLAGRVSFEVFSLDSGATTLDGGVFGDASTTFDNLYTFTVRASDIDGTVEDYRTFTVSVIQANEVPYENLYLKALPSSDQREIFLNIITDQQIFPPTLIYRETDPNFGRATDIKSLFLPGLAPSTAADYVAAASKNHYTKRLTFGEIKTARALDSSFNTKYEVVYVELLDENTNEFGQGPDNIIDLTSVISTPFYDKDGNEFTIAYPNSFVNMQSEMADSLGYANKGALPDWMTSKQVDGKILGFVRAAVLAYALPGKADTIAYRLRESEFNLNDIDFTIDRYQLDNILTENYNIEEQSYTRSNETTFDRYPGVSSIFVDVGTVDYALSVSYESINGRTVEDIIDEGGLDGITNFRDGDTLVFAEQEFRRDQADLGEYNQGWSDVQSLWDADPWAYNANTSDSDILIPSADTSPGLAWDKSEYVPGYNEHLLDSLVDNKRIGVWRVNIIDGNIVTLTFEKTLNFYEKLFVRRGFTYGKTNIFFDPSVKIGNQVPNYSIIPQQVRTTYTKFDGNGTRFFDYRDEYALPESGDKYIKFTKTGVFT